MFKEYTYNGHQSQPSAQQSKIGVDLTLVAAFVRTPGTGVVSLYLATGASIPACNMTEAEFEEFKVNLKTANRLKRAYE